jgi:hypothetical protein
MIIDQLLDWISELGTGILASIIASVIVGALFVFRISKRKGKMEIEDSKITGDVIQGDKLEGLAQRSRPLVEKRDSTVKIKGSIVSGDVVQGDKEKRKT